MKTFKNLALMVLSLATAVSATAQTQTYTSKAAFIAQLPPGYYFNDFSSLTAGAAAGMSFSFTNGTPAVSYTVSAAPGGLYVNAPGSGIGNYHNSDDILITFTSGNVQFVGAEFFLSDSDGRRQLGSIAIAFSDGTTAIVPSYETGDYGFFGVSSDAIIESLTVTHGGNFLNVGSLFSAWSVPEPTATTLFLLGAGLCILRRKRA
jgi:hypothetical protein